MMFEFYIHVCFIIWCLNGNMLVILCMHFILIPEWFYMYIPAYVLSQAWLNKTVETKPYPGQRAVYLMPVINIGPWEMCILSKLIFEILQSSTKSCPSLCMIIRNGGGPWPPTTRQIWGIWKLRPAYSPETSNLGQNRWCFVPYDLEIWWMTMENNRASLLCCFKLCATFHSHRWIQTGVTVR